MTHPITNPEEHLREAAVNYVRGPTSGTFGARDELYAAAEAYAESVGRSSPEPAPLRCEPPEEHRHIPFHWVIRPMCTINPWAIFWSQVRECWQSDGNDWRPEEVAKYEWRYHSPCLPEVADQVHPTDTRVQPTDEAIERFWHEYAYSSQRVTIIDGIKRALAHFSPTQTITPVEPEITDHEIEVLWGEVLAELHCTSPASIVPFARRLLAKYSIQPTRAQWEAIRHLAVTEAPEVFADEASAVLRQQA